MEFSQQPSDVNVPRYSVISPVLLIAFNRPEETSRVISRLREVKPKTIYFAVDGPRADRPDDKDLVQITQSLQSQFDWDCSVSVRFLDENVGCGLGVSTAITWALKSEENIIILEDDIVPNISFFRFCDDMLDFYALDDDVFSVSGCNFVPEEMLSRSENYRFSSIPNVWGWAVWKRSWEKYSFEMANWRNELSIRELRESLGGSYIATFMFSRIFDLIAANKIDTWDYQLLFAALKSKSLVVTPNRSLITNIGFGNNATHTAIAPSYILEAHEMRILLPHPVKQSNFEIDKWYVAHAHGASPARLAKSIFRFTYKRFRLRKLRKN